MCTAIYDNRSGAFLGRTLDVEQSYKESVVTVPRGCAFDTVHTGRVEYKNSAVGIAFVSGGVPLFFDGINSAGLAACALNFGLSCTYHQNKNESLNLAPFEVIPYALARYCTVDELVQAFALLNIVRDGFGNLPTTPLHWIFADRTRAVTLESTDSGTHIYENKLGILTNAPEYPYHLYRAADIMGLSAEGPEDKIGNGTLFRYSRGMGGIGLPGDNSSSSRFLRALFNKSYSCDYKNENSVTDFFHLFDSVSVTRGTVVCDDGSQSYTAYTSVMDLEKKRYYFTTYNNRQIRAVNMPNDKKCKQICSYTMQTEPKIEYLN